MKMAKASPADLDAASALVADLEGLVADARSGCWPACWTESETEEFFDVDDPGHLRLFFVFVSGLVRSCPPGGLSRVVEGMRVILDPANNVVDPDAKTLELHPTIRQALAWMETRRPRPAAGDPEFDR